MNLRAFALSKYGNVFCTSVIAAGKLLAFFAVWQTCTDMGATDFLCLPVAPETLVLLVWPVP